MKFPPIFLHYLDSELASGVGYVSTASSVQTITQCLLVGTTSSLYCALSRVWESPTDEKSLIKFIYELVAHNQIDLFSRFETLDSFLESKRQSYAHNAKRHPSYFVETLPTGIRIEPTQWKNSSTSEALQLKLLTWATTSGANATHPKVENDLSTTSALKKIVIQSFADRRGQAITFPLFEPYLHSENLGAIEATVLNRKILVSYCEHYLEFARGDLPSGIRGLSLFDRMAATFPFYDVPILFEVLRYSGLEDLCRGEQFRLRREFLAVRNSDLHLEVVSRLQAFMAGVLGVSGLGLGEEASYANRAIVLQTARQILSKCAGSTILRRNVKDYLGRALDYLGFVLRTASTNAVFEEAKRMIEVVSDEHIDVLLVTATTTESEVVLSAFQKETKRKYERKFIRDHTYYDLGLVFGCRVFLAQSEMGSGGPSGSLVTVSDAIMDMKPAFIIMVGVAFGLKRDKQKIGDVLVSRQVLNYELQRISNKQRILRGDRAQSTPLLLDRFRSGAVDWKKCNVHFGLIVSGEKLADSTVFTRELLENEPEAIGGEMEGAGLYAASLKSRSRWIIVKGISDWGENKSSDFQKQAAGNAVDFVLHVIRQGALTEGG